MSASHSPETWSCKWLGNQPERIARVRRARQSKKLMGGIKEIYSARFVSRGVPLHSGATCRISFVSRKATICSGTGKFTFPLVIRAPKTRRICSKCIPTSRPHLSPASVTAKKSGDFTSTHCESPAKTVDPLQRKQSRTASGRKRKEKRTGPLGASVHHTIPRFGRRHPTRSALNSAPAQTLVGHQSSDYTESLSLIHI